MLFQGTQVQFPEPTWQLMTVTPVPEDLTPSHRHTCRQNTSAHKINNEMFLNSSILIPSIAEVKRERPTLIESPGLPPFTENRFYLRVMLGSQKNCVRAAVGRRHGTERLADARSRGHSPLVLLVRVTQLLLGLDDPIRE